MKLTSLDKIEVNKECKIINIEVEREIKFRLLDMGLIPDTKIKVIKKAPLGDPIQILLRGYNISIRKEIAKNIFVEVI